MDRLMFFSIGSGSSGNCYYIGTASYGILIDAGIAARTVAKELKKHGLSFKNIWGVFITHDHTDHIKAVGTLSEKHHLPIYLTAKMHEGVNKNHRVTDKLGSSCRHFEKGDTIDIREFSITSFPVSHDASDCVGYYITFGDQHFVIATDLGYINKEAADYIVRANYLVIEANYDEVMLKNGKYPYPLKERVRSHTGHLSNDHTARFIADNYSPILSHIFLCHLSQENNTPEIALQTITDALKEKDITSVEVVHPLERTTASPLYIFRPYSPEK